MLGVDDLDTTGVPHANRRIGAKELEVRRLVLAELTARRPPAEAHRTMQRLDGLPELLADDVPFAGLSRAEATQLMRRCARGNATFARASGIDPAGVLFRDSGVAGGGTRPGPVRWDHLPPAEQRAVREYVRQATGVALEPWPGTGHRPVGPLGRLRVALPFGSPLWRASWLVDPHFLRHCAAGLARRLERGRDRRANRLVRHRSRG